MRSEEEIRKQFAILSRDAGEGKMLTVDEIKEARRTRTLVVRDARYRREIEDYWFRWVLNDKGEK